MLKRLLVMKSIILLVSLLFFVGCSTIDLGKATNAVSSLSKISIIVGSYNIIDNAAREYVRMTIEEYEKENKLNRR